MEATIFPARPRHVKCGSLGYFRVKCADTVPLQTAPLLVCDGTTMKIPAGYQQVMPYLIVRDAAKFIDFTSKVFGAVERLRIMRDERHIKHAEIKIGDSVIMFADATEQFGPRTAALFVYVEDADQTYHKALAEGATSVMPMSDQEYGRSGGVADPFGNLWWPTTPPRK